MVGRRRRSLRRSLLIFAVGYMTLLLVGLEVPLGVVLNRQRMSSFRSKVVGEMGILAGEVAEGVGREAGIVSETPHPGRQLLAAVAATATALRGRVVIVDASSRVLADSAGRLAPGTQFTSEPSVPGILSSAPGAEPEVVSTSDGDLRVVSPVLEAGRTVGAAIADVPLGDQRGDARSVWFALAGSGFVALWAGLAIAWWLARSVAAPAEQLEQVAARFGAGDLDARAAEGGPREIAGLAMSFNAMAADLAASVRAQQDFAANASHQIRTPLTALELCLDALGHDDVDAAHEVEQARSEVARLNRLVTDLLGLARASAPPREVARPVDLGEIAATVLERWAESAARAGRRIALHLDAPAIVECDADDVEHMLDHLIDNALRYSRPQARIDVTVHGASLQVEDDGPGIPPDERDRIFERFYRGSTGRRAGPGTGLGLPVVAELARRWRADLRLVPSAGAAFEITFPRPGRQPPARVRAGEESPKA